MGCYAVLELWASLRLHVRKPAIWNCDPCTNSITRNLPFLNAGQTFSVFADGSISAAVSVAPCAPRGIADSVRFAR
jgi:hypothetical protein